MTNTDLVTDAIAVAAIASPWWIPSLEQVHDGAAWVLPLLGVLWLAMQIGAWLYARRP